MFLVELQKTKSIVVALRTLSNKKKATFVIDYLIICEMKTCLTDDFFDVLVRSVKVLDYDISLNILRAIALCFLHFFSCFFLF